MGQAVIRKTRLSNAMGTPLALVVLVTLTSLIIYALTDAWFLLVIALLPVLYFIRAFDYLMKNHPRLLRTEEHEEKMLALKVGAMGQKGNELSEQQADRLPLMSTTEELAEGDKNG